ncbi:unnamed protein product [Pipistrellus nathusii]|uniref:Uncharacterized protein n=1 Tax=Pipistrellus nathusii TaxID=59473 RepID=A0ABN9ZG15_PIPNA
MAVATSGTGRCQLNKVGALQHQPPTGCVAEAICRWNIWSKLYPLHTGPGQLFSRDCHLKEPQETLNTSVMSSMERGVLSRISAVHPKTLTGKAECQCACLWTHRGREDTRNAGQASNGK